MFCVLLNFGFISCVVVFSFGGESSDFILSLFSSGQIYVHCGTKKDRTTMVVRSIICAVVRQKTISPTQPR